MLLLLLLLSFMCCCVCQQDGREARLVPGLKNPKSGLCMCEVDSNMWSLNIEKYVSVLEQVQTCEKSFDNLLEQLQISTERLPQIQKEVSNITERLEPFQYLHNRGLYKELALRTLGEELSQLETDIDIMANQFNNTSTRKLSKEVVQLQKDAKKMQSSDLINMKTVREKLRYLKNTVESCKSIPKDLRGQDRHCFKGLITKISDPVTTKIAPQGTTYISGSWGRQSQMDSEEQKNSYWVQTLLKGNAYGNTLQVYKNYADFIAASNDKVFTFAPSYTDSKAIDGPSAVLYGQALYYHCYNSPDICRYDLKTTQVQRVTLPGIGVGFNNKFPYCYYNCRLNSDVDVEADEMGLWVIYTTMGNHGNMVVSRLLWDSQNQTLNVSQTWETRLFKKAATNAFMVCGVLYATRYVDDFREEVFYAFDTATGKEDNSLSLPLEKVAKEVASLSYNPTDKKLYMYNDGYLLAYSVSGNINSDWDNEDLFSDDDEDDDEDFYSGDLLYY